MRSATGFAALTVLAIWPCAARAAPVYFHRPGVPQATYAADATECEELAGAIPRQRQPVPYSPNMYAMAAGSFFAAFFAGREQRRLVDNVMRTCMADKGYRRVEPSGPERKELGKLRDRERVERLFALAAAPQPAGKVLPR